MAARAVVDFNRVYDLGVQQFGVYQSDAYALGIPRVFDFLTDFPRAARERKELKGFVRAFPYKSHVIIYQIVSRDDDILIVRIRHSREDWLSTR